MILAATWLLAVAGKAVSPKYTFHQFDTLLSFGTPTIVALALGLGLLQLAVASLTFAGKVAGYFAGSGLSLSLLIFETLRIRTGSSGPCGCFGEAIQLTPLVSHLVTTVVFAASLFLSFDALAPQTSAEPRPRPRGEVMKRPTRTLANLGLSLLLPLLLVNFGLGRGTTSGPTPVLGSYQCTGTQCTGSGGCRATPKFGGSANYTCTQQGECEWTIWSYGTCVNHAGLDCLTIKYYTDPSCSTLTRTSATTTTGC